MKPAPPVSRIICATLGHRPGRASRDGPDFAPRKNRLPSLRTVVEVILPVLDEAESIPHVLAALPAGSSRWSLTTARATDPLRSRARSARA